MLIPMADGLGRALKAARGKTGQRELSETAFGTPSRQGAISRWEHNVERPSLEEIAAIEGATGRPRGWILIRAGYVDLPTDTRSAIEADPALDDARRPLVLLAYEFGVGGSAANK